LAEPSDGVSLYPLLHGDAGRAADLALSEYLAEGVSAPALMIRRGRYKYIYGEPDTELLYDLAADPHELKNLVDQPAQAEAVSAFRAELRRRWDVAVVRGRVIASQRRRRLVGEALRQGGHTPWDFQPYQDASRQYMRNHLDLNDLERRARYPAPPVIEPARR
jgi:choline-sulfatase